VLHLIKALPKTQSCFLATKEIQICRHHIADASKGGKFTTPTVHEELQATKFCLRSSFPWSTKGDRADFTMQTAHPHKEGEDQ
jgi:hypothetical protein